MTRPMRKTALVTGGSGRLGRVVVAELDGSYDVVVADVVSPPSGWAGAFVALDVRDLDAVSQAVAGADVVVHLAALDYDTHAAPEAFIDVNTVGTWNLLRACAQGDVSRVVVCSSVAALGLHELRPECSPLTLPVEESHEPQPAEAYSVSKLIVETMAAAVARSHQTNVLCIRPAAVIFPDQVDKFLATVDPRGPGLFDYITAEDVAAAIALALGQGWHGFDVVTVCADDSAHPDPTLTWYPYKFGSLPSTVDHDHFAENPRASVYSNRKAFELFGWKPRSDFLSIQHARDEEVNR
jgi:UDP-glucose 4-epimerase